MLRMSSMLFAVSLSPILTQMPVQAGNFTKFVVGAGIAAAVTGIVVSQAHAASKPAKPPHVNDPLVIAPQPVANRPAEYAGAPSVEDKTEFLFRANEALEVAEDALESEGNRIALCTAYRAVLLPDGTTLNEQVWGTDDPSRATRANLSRGVMNHAFYDCCLHVGDRFVINPVTLWMEKMGPFAGFNVTGAKANELKDAVEEYLVEPMFQDLLVDLRQAGDQASAAAAPSCKAIGAAFLMTR